MNLSDFLHDLAHAHVFVQWFVVVYTVTIAVGAIGYALVFLVKAVVWWLDRHDRRFIRWIEGWMRASREAKAPPAPSPLFLEDPLTDYERSRGF